MFYDVVTWGTYSADNPLICNYCPVFEMRPGMAQAVINDIRKNEYFFDNKWNTYPVLNTGEIIVLSDGEFERMFSEAYGISVEEYKNYLEKYKNFPDIKTSEHDGFELQIREIAWVKSDRFDEFKNELLSGGSNFELLPANMFRLKENDVLIFKTEDKKKSFQVRVKRHIRGVIMEIGDVFNIKDTSTSAIIDFFFIR